MKVLAIDPGSEVSGWVVYDGERVLEAGVSPNHDILYEILYDMEDVGSWLDCDTLVIESFAPRGQPLYSQLVDTAIWIGRFTQAWDGEVNVHLVVRDDAKRHLCGGGPRGDANVRAALIDRFGGKDKAIGTKKDPGPLRGVKSHAWAALAVAVTWMDRAVAAAQEEGGER